MPWDFFVILVILGVVIPWRGHIRLKKLLAQPSADTKEKLALYAATIAFQWLMCGLVAWRATARGLTVPELGLGKDSWGPLLLWGIGGGVLIGGLQGLNLRRIGRMEGAAPDRMRTLARNLLPVNLIEYLPFSALAITAGVCEEFLYRGFVLAAFFRAALPVWAAVVLASLLFGFAHAYQGKAGIVSTGLFGVVLAVARLAIGSLVPVMIWHASLDLAAGIAAPKYLLKAQMSGPAEGEK